MPSGSEEPEASKLTAVPVGTGLGVAVKEAVGARFSTVTLTVVVAAIPSSSVTRRPTGMFPEAAYVFVALGVVPVSVS